MTSLSEPEEQAKRLHDECQKLLRTEAKLERWHKEEEARHEAHKTQLQAQKDNTTNELVQYAQVTCRNLCTKISKVCPREIRDSIYAHLLPDSPAVLAHIPQHACDCDICIRGNDLLKKFVQPPEHLLKATYVTPDFSEERLEKWYRTSTFDLREHFAKIGAFRTMDAGNFGIIPADYILDISMYIPLSTYDFEGIVAPPHAEQLVKSHRRLLADLEALLGFRSGTKIVLHMAVERAFLPVTKAKKEWECEAAVPVILPTMRRPAGGGT
ncbi:hypothetical protein J4E91_005268 [Alternaria rosae]|nr:hypothetical protein J4E91_005268 [Alternaria rosae]